MSVFDEMRKDWERAEATGDQLAAVVFWCFAWTAWIGIAVFLVLAFMGEWPG